MDIKVKRVATQFDKKFTDIISMEDFVAAKPTASEEEVKNAFYSRCLAAFAIVMKANCELQDAAASVTDGYQDGGIDAVYVDKTDKIVYIIQAKWIQDAHSGISQGDLLKFSNGLDEMIAMNFQGFNEKLKRREEEICEALSAVDYHMKAIIIGTTVSSLSPENKKVFEKLKNSLNEGDIELFDYECLLLPQITQRIIDDTSDKEITIDDLTLNDWGVITYDDSPQGYYGTVSAEKIANWWQNYGNKLLHKNIRNFKGDTEVNKGMIHVLTQTPELFCFYNNGIKILAQDIKKKLANANNRKAGDFVLKNASIVNGAQTYGSIGNAYKENAGQASKATVFVQIISLNGMQSDMGNTITKLSNTQNRIENKDFVALDSTQEYIRQIFSLDSIEYLYKTGEVPSHFDKSCTLDEATVSMGCYLDDITVSANIKRSYGTFFEQLDKPPYISIFNKGISTRLLWNCIVYYREFDKLIADFQNKEQPNRLIAIHGNRFLLHGIYQIYKQKLNHYQTYIEPTDIDSSQFKKNIADLIEAVAQAKMDLYPDSYAANIFKNANKCRELEKKIDYNKF